MALRVPGHPLAQSLLQEFAGPIAAPSATSSGRISPTEASHVLAGLSGRIDAVLDGGPTEVGLESTIVGLVGRPTLLRPGGLPSEAIEDCLGRGLMAQEDGIISAPGQLASHYAPRVPGQIKREPARKRRTVHRLRSDCGGDTQSLGSGRPARGRGKSVSTLTCVGPRGRRHRRCADPYDRTWPGD